MKRLITDNILHQLTFGTFPTGEKSVEMDQSTHNLITLEVIRLQIQHRC